MTARPVSLTVAAAGAGSQLKGDPEELLAVGGLPAATTTVRGGVKKASAVAAVATANGSDAATTQALANQLKTTLNDLLSKLQAAGITV